MAKRYNYTLVWVVGGKVASHNFSTSKRAWLEFHSKYRNMPCGDDNIVVLSRELHVRKVLGRSQLLERRYKPCRRAK